MHEGQYNFLSLVVILSTVVFVSFIFGYNSGNNFSCEDTDQTEYIKYEGSIADYDSLPEDYPADIYWETNKSTSNAEGSMFLLSTDKVSVNETMYFKFEEEIDITCRNGEVMVDTYIGWEEELNESIW